MNIRILGSPQRAARALARDVARMVRSNPRLVLGLPTGQTPIPFYRELVALYEAGGIDLSRVTTFNLDEFLGIDENDPGSYGSYMNRHLFDHVNLSSRRIHLLDGSTDDWSAECERFERAIARAGGIDLLVLGLGSNGHIGFNEPATSLAARTHRTRLARSTRRANAPLFGGNVRRVPREALSMGMGTMLKARRIVLLVTGHSKAACLERVVRGPITTLVPASLLQLHGHIEVWADRPAASGLTKG